MKLIELSQTDKDRYNRFVMDSEAGPFLQSWEWGEWQENLGHKVYRFFITDNKSEDIISAVQLIEMPVTGRKFYLYAPYGPVVGSRKPEVGSRMMQELKNRFPKAMFVRLEPQQNIEGLDKAGRKTINIQPGITMVVDIAKTDEELLSAMHPKTRYNIKLAQRHGVSVQNEPVVTPGYGLYVQEAIDLIVQTQSRQKYRGHSLAYYRQLIDFLSVNNARNDLCLHIYKALYNRDLLATGVMIDFGKTRTYLYGGSSSKHKNLMAPYLLHWQAMRDARGLGMACYDLGGSEVSGGGERGFTRFKQGFGGKVVNFAGAYDIVFNKAQYKIYQVLRFANRLKLKLTR